MSDASDPTKQAAAEAEAKRIKEAAAKRAQAISHLTGPSHPSKEPLKKFIKDSEKRDERAENVERTREKFNDRNQQKAERKTVLDKAKTSIEKEKQNLKKLESALIKVNGSLKGNFEGLTKTEIERIEENKKSLEDRIKTSKKDLAEATKLQKRNLSEFRKTEKDLNKQLDRTERKFERRDKKLAKSESKVSGEQQRDAATLGQRETDIVKSDYKISKKDAEAGIKISTRKEEREIAKNIKEGKKEATKQEEHLERQKRKLQPHAARQAELQGKIALRNRGIADRDKEIADLKQLNAKADAQINANLARLKDTPKNRKERAEFARLRKESLNLERGIESREKEIAKSQKVITGLKKEKGKKEEKLKPVDAKVNYYEGKKAKNPIEKRSRVQKLAAETAAAKDDAYAKRLTEEMKTLPTKEKAKENLKEAKRLLAVTEEQIKNSPKTSKLAGTLQDTLDDRKRDVKLHEAIVNRVDNAPKLQSAPQPSAPAPQQAQTTSATMRLPDGGTMTVSHSYPTQIQQPQQMQSLFPQMQMQDMMQGMPQMQRMQGVYYTGQQQMQQQRPPVTPEVIQNTTKYLDDLHKSSPATYDRSANQMQSLEEQLKQNPQLGTPAHSQLQTDTAKWCANAHAEVEKYHAACRGFFETQAKAPGATDQQKAFCTSMAQMSAANEMRAGQDRIINQGIANQWQEINKHQSREAGIAPQQQQTIVVVQQAPQQQQTMEQKIETFKGTHEDMLKFCTRRIEHDTKMLERHDIKADPQFKAACVASKMDAEKTRESIISKAATQGLAVSLNGKGEVEVKQAVEATVATTKQNVAQAFNAERIAVNRAHTPNKPVVATPAKDTPALSLDIRGLDLAHMQQEGSLGPRTTPQKLADAMIAFTTNKTWPEPKKQDSSLPITLTPDAPGAGKTPEVGVVVK